MGAINQALASDKVIRVNDFELLGMVQSFDWAPELGATDIYEMGNRDKVDTAYDLRTSGSIEFASIGNTAGILARIIPSRNATTDAFLGYQYNSGGASGKNAYTFTEADLVETRFDIIQHERPDSKTFSRSLWLPRQTLASLSGSARADGFATESMTFRGADVVGFNNPYHDVRAIPATWNSATSATLADTAVGTSTYTLAYVYVNDRRFRNSSTTDATKFTLGAAGQLTMTTTESYAMPQDADITALVYKTTPGTTFPTLSTAQRGTTATYVRGQQVNIFLAPANAATPTDAEKFLRVQSLDWSIDLGLQELMELQRNDKGTATYYHTPTLPLDISCNATVYETDWKDWAQMMTGKTNADIYTSSYEFSPATIKTGFAIVVQYYTKGSPASLVQQWTFSDMAPTARGTRVSVRGRGEVSWSFKGTAMKLQGWNV